MFGPNIRLMNEGGESDNNALRLGTRRTRHIINLMRPEWPDDQLAHGVGNCKTTNPSAIPRSASAIYNCVGMVFATRRTWVEPQYVYQLLDDDGYTQLSRITDAYVGDVAVYKNLESGEVAHVGVFIERKEDLSTATVSFKVLSKWGPWAEYIHDPDDVLPNFGILSEVWTDRKNSHLWMKT